MKRSSFAIKIEKPCTENWSSMTVNDSGKFCSSCQKNVIDFTNCSDEELIRILEKSEGKVCGRLQKNQLERILVASKNRKVSPHLNKILAGLFALGMIESSDLKAQQEHINIKTTWSPDTTQNAVAKNNSSQHVGSEDPTTLLAEKDPIAQKYATPFRVSGKIISYYDSLPINEAIVIIKNSKIGVFTDSLGNFSFEIPDSLLSDTITLRISATGYEFTETKIAKAKINSPIVIPLYYEMMMGEFIQYTPPEKRKRRGK